jgi:succinyl-CoA synthetase beta subunit
MKLHEYQAKELFKEYGIPAPAGRMVTTARDAKAVADAIGYPVVLKAQVHVGGRGKAGGIRIIDEPAATEAAADDILRLTIKGLPVRKLMLAASVDIAEEVYLSILIDRGARSVVFVGCAEGGIEIEQTAKDSPEKILRLEIRTEDLPRLTTDHVRPMAARLFGGADQAAATAEIMVRVAKLFYEKDCSLVEINPLVLTPDGEVLALDAKVLLDDNALFRHPELANLRDLDSEDPDELAAKEQGLSFIRLDGTIGCMVNGAGLAMATMDTIKHFGGDPANFLDVGGSSDPQKVVTAFRMILKNPDITAILINIFGGITRCDDIARGILQSLEAFEVPVPVIIRLIGTNEQEGRALLEGTELTTVQTLEEGAQKAAQIGGRA